MCEQITIEAVPPELSPQSVYGELRPYIDSILEEFNFSPSHIVATKIAEGLSVRYNIKKSIFSILTDYEGDEPPGVRVIFRITSNTKGTRIEIPQNRLQYYDVEDLPLVPTSAKQPAWRKIDVMHDRLPALAEAACQDIANYLLTYPSDFGCCSLNEQCSDAGKCLQSNQDMAASCYYKKNLMQGNIFYGRNAAEYKK